MRFALATFPYLVCLPSHVILVDSSLTADRRKSRCLMVVCLTVCHFETFASLSVSIINMDDGVYFDRFCAGCDLPFDDGQKVRRYLNCMHALCSFCFEVGT